MDDAISIVIFGLMSALNPTLLAAVTIMLLLPNPKRLMIGYLLGAYLTSITVGLLIVFQLHGDASVATTKRTLSPLGDILVGALLVIAGVVLKGQRMQARSERRKEAKAAKEKKESLPERLLGRGDPRITFFVGVLLTFPGASYLAALARTSKLDLAEGWIVLIVVSLCLVQQLLLELPIIAYTLRPEWAKEAIARFRTWLAQNGRRTGANVAVGLGGLAILRGVIGLIAGS
ncbi:MAG: GAP family protein [Actinobacteria bacterium]|nr:GAP family protein [Actinomycetota bacterium]